MKKLRLETFAIFLAVSVSQYANSAVIYSEDFEGINPDLSSWSVSEGALQVTSDQAASAHHVLGSDEPFGSGFFNRNETVRLTLQNVQAGRYSVAFDFFAIYTWDGDGSNCCGPDTFAFAVNGVDLLSTFFNQSVSYRRQSELLLSYVYSPSDPNNPDDPNHQPGDTVDVFSNAYRPEFEFEHIGGSIVFEFTANTDQAGSENYDSGYPDEPWALDNLIIERVAGTPVPSPTILALLGIGICARLVGKRIGGTH